VQGHILSTVGDALIQLHLLKDVSMYSLLFCGPGEDRSLHEGVKSLHNAPITGGSFSLLRPEQSPILRPRSGVQIPKNQFELI